MAIGQITSPTTWIIGTGVTPTWLQNMQDTLNNAYLYKSNNDSYSKSRDIWIPASFALPMSSSQWNATGGYGGSVWNCSNTSGTMFFAIPLFWQTGSTTVYQQVSAVNLRCYQAGAAGITAAIYSMAGLNGSSAPTATSLASTTGPASSGEKTITVTNTVTAGPQVDAQISVLVTPATVGDRIYGIRVTYDNHLW